MLFQANKQTKWVESLGNELTFCNSYLFPLIVIYWQIDIEKPPFNLF